MAITVTMIAPAQSAGFNVTARSGTVYKADANGLISAAVGDVNSLQQAGCIVTPDRPVVSLALSSATGVYVVPGAINLVAASTVAAVALLLPVAGYNGQVTTLVSASTGNVTITSSGVTLMTEKAAAATVLTCGLGVADLVATGSTLYQLQNRSLNTSSGGAVYGILSS